MKITKFYFASVAVLAMVASCEVRATSISLAPAVPDPTSQVPDELTNAPATTFFGNVGSYFVSSNTNQPIHGRAEVGLGVVYQSGVNIGSDLDFRYKVYQLSLLEGTNAGDGFFLESVTRNAGVAGVIVSQQVGGGFYYIPASTPDIELSAGLLAGYRFDVAGTAFTVYADIRKTTTQNTFLGARIAYEYDAEDAPPAPVVTAYTGFLF